MSEVPARIIYSFRGFDVKVVTSKELEEGEYGPHGGFDDKRTIFMTTEGIPDCDQADTMLHEYLHGVASTLGLFKQMPHALHQEERIVHAFSAAVSELIQRNPDVLDWLVKKLRSPS
jgi:hypothetical protein